MTKKCFPLDENTLYADFAVSILSLAPPHLEYEQHLFLALIASVSVFVGLPNLLFLLRTSFFGPSTAMVYWNIQCLFASD